MAIDHIDRTIIDALRRNARLSVRNLAGEIGQSPSATSDRFQRLVAAGVITAFTIDVAPEATGRPLDALVDVQLAPGTEYRTIDDELLAMPQVIDAMHLTGQFDYQLRARCRDVADLESLILALKETGVVHATQTRIVLRSATAMPRPVALD